MLSQDLNALALNIRRLALAAIFRAGSGHPGGSLSAADILAVLFARELKWSGVPHGALDRPRFVLSKGHACPALYAAMAESGLCPRAEVLRFRRLGSPMQGHPHVGTLPWIDASTGSLGQGFSVALGMALGMRKRESSARAYVLLGDGELQEGQVWEAAMAASHHGVDNLCAIVDYNTLQSDAPNRLIMNVEPLHDKWRAFGWYVLDADGHDVAALTCAFAQARAKRDVPTIIIAHTVKGKGVSFMEGVPAWHGSVRMRSDETISALQELDCGRELITELLGVPPDTIAPLAASIK